MAVIQQNIVELVNVTKEYNGQTALKSVNLTVMENEFLTLLGPSGCGKTTTLRIIGGFEHPTSGKVLFRGVDINSTPPYKRKVNTVFQKYALFRHLNVYENVAFGLRIKKIEKDVIQKKVHEILSLVNLDGYEKRDVDFLSGGQQQRVAIARALVNEPEVLLLDEPLGALDLKLRKEMQIELKNIQQRLGITFIYVTHDQEEALTMSDTVAVMQDGVIQQTGSPVEIYNEPKNAFVADFIGESNIIDGIMQRDYLVDFAGYTFECIDTGFKENEPVDVVIRPEDLKMDRQYGVISGVVGSVIFKGVHYETIVFSRDINWMVHSTKAEPIGTEVLLSVAPDDIQIMKKLARK